MTEQKTDYITEMQTIPAEQELPEPEGFVNCDNCNSILGFKAHIGKVLFLFTYRYPRVVTVANLYKAEVNSRMLSGDVFCNCCHNWQMWNAAVERPWEKPTC